jgi:O-antigen/teichoic acid export membrane protein
MTTQEPSPKSGAPPSARPSGRIPSAPPSQGQIAHEGAMAKEVGVAARNLVKLGLSLIGTWTVTLMVRFQLPRFLGAEAFGDFYFADSFALATFAFLEFGVEVYVQKEVSVHPKHASEFFGGVVLLRALLSIVLIAGMIIFLKIKDRSHEVQLATFIFALNYFVFSINNTLASLLQATATVGRLAIVNVAVKIVWGAMLIAALVLKAPMPILAVPMVLAEVLRTVLLFPATRAALDLHFHVMPAIVKSVLIKSLPYFIASAALQIAGRINIIILDMMMGDHNPENGWLSSAAGLGSLAMLLYPLLTWIVMPLLARARQRSVEDTFKIIRFSLEGLVVLSVPVALFVGIGADYWVKLAFKNTMPESAMALMTIAPTFVLTYTAMILSIALVILEKQWVTVRNSIIALVATPFFIVMIVPLAARTHVPGAIAAGAGAGTFFTELIVSVSCLYNVGKRAVDARTIMAVLKSCVIAGGVIVLDHFLRPLGWVRVVLDMLAYAAVALATGAIRIKEALLVVKMARENRRGGGTPAPA